MSPKPRCSCTTQDGPFDGRDPDCPLHGASEVTTADPREPVVEPQRCECVVAGRWVGTGCSFCPHPASDHDDSGCAKETICQAKVTRSGNVFTAICDRHGVLSRGPNRFTAEVVMDHHNGEVIYP